MRSSSSGTRFSSSLWSAQESKWIRTRSRVASVAEVHMYFPDPWTKKREQKRRIIRAEALQEIRRVMVKGGSGILVTDHRDYYDVAAPLIAQFFQSEARIPGPDDPPRSNYEAKYRAEGREIYEVRFWKE